MRVNNPSQLRHHNRWRCKICGEKFEKIGTSMAGQKAAALYGYSDEEPDQEDDNLGVDVKAMKQIFDRCSWVDGP